MMNIIKGAALLLLHEDPCSLARVKVLVINISHQQLIEMTIPAIDMMITMIISFKSQVPHLRPLPGVPLHPCPRHS